MEDLRFNISAEKYLERHDVLTYIEDAVTQLLDHKEENPKVNPAKFFSDYFTSIKDGNHVIFREYAYVNATFHNQSSFVRTFWKCFRHIGKKGDLLSISGYHSLICLLCPDFPFHPVQKTARIILMDDAQDCLISFTDFLYAFQAQFCYDEFLTKCAEVYKSLLEDPHISHDPVVVPTSEETPASVAHEANHVEVGFNPTDGVDSMLFFRALMPVIEKLDLRAPPVSALREILGSAKRVTFYGFLMALAKSEGLNEAIGKLPPKVQLLDISDQELTAPPIRPSSALGHPPLAASHPHVSASLASTNKSGAEAGDGHATPSRTSKAARFTHKSLGGRRGTVPSNRKPVRQPVESEEEDDDDDDDEDSSDSGSSDN